MNSMVPAMKMAEIAWRQQRVHDEFKRASAGRRYRARRRSTRRGGEFQ
ncbi:MAG TPA: hypothetical protein VGL26_09435 [Jatrophihabitans sp.]|jgi:hypothetical protein